MTLQRATSNKQSARWNTGWGLASELSGGYGAGDGRQSFGVRGGGESKEPEGRGFQVMQRRRRMGPCDVDEASERGAR